MYHGYLDGISVVSAALDASYMYSTASVRSEVTAL